MRVVHVGFHLDRHRREPAALLDAWPVLMALATAVRSAGPEVVVVQPAHTEATLRRTGVVYRFVVERPAIFRRGTPGTRPVRAPGTATVGAVAEADPDVVHVSGLSLPRFARHIRERVPSAAIVAQDHADRPPSPWRRPGARRAARAYDAVAFTAREQATPFFETGVFPPGLSVHEVPEASSDFRPGPVGAARRSVGVHGDPALAWVGHLDANKDPLTVLEGLAAAAPDLPDAHLWCCYRDAPLLDRVRRRIAEDPRLRGRVHLLGTWPQRRVERLLRAADGLVQGSHREGSSFSVIEAMACGATPVVTDIPSFARLVGDVGHVWTPGDPAALAAALRRLGDGDAAVRRERVRRRFDAALSWRAVGERWVEIYRSVHARAEGAQARPETAAPSDAAGGRA